MRTIILSTDVFAALWSQRRPGEDSENAILERLLGLPKGPPLAQQAAGMAGQVRGGLRAGNGGIYNTTFDVHFPPGFEIFRTYKSKNYTALVQDGHWWMNGERFRSLFALSMAIIDSRENPWRHWKYRDAKGRTDFISALRNIPPELEESAPPAPSPARPAKKAAKKPRRA